MVTLLLLGFALSLDSFRVSLGLGTLKLSRLRQLQIVIAFGVCDALAPLIGLLIGQSLLKIVGPWVEHLGPLLLCAYGVYVIYIAKRCTGTETGETDRWMVLGLPLSLSLDNLIAGTSLGLLGVPPVLAAAIFAATTAVMSFVGLCLGRIIGRLIHIRADLLSGVALVIMAVVLAL